MNEEHGNDESVFAEFKEHFEQRGGDTPSEAEEAFMARIAPRVQRIARRKLTSEVRRAFDSNDITSTVMRRVVGCVRGGTLRLESEGEFMSMLMTMTRNAIIDKHDYLNRLVRQHDREHSADAGGSDDEGTRIDLTAADDVRRQQSNAVDSTPVDDAILTEKLEHLNTLCFYIQNKCQLQPDEWHLFKLRILEEKPWKEIALEMGMVDSDGNPAPDTARMRVKRIIDEIRPRLRRYQQWLDEEPT